MNKIKLATVFSGIGAPEQALERLHIPYTTIFACDNGDVTPRCNIANEYKKVCSLKTVEQKRRYVKGLYKYTTRGLNLVETSYLANYKVKNDNFFQDINLLDGRDFAGEVDILVGGSPCQSFSVMGAQKGLDDPRGQLFFQFCRIINEVQPKVFVWENVCGVLIHRKGKTWERMQEEFDNTGYHYTQIILNSNEYGIPQDRPRLFVIGFKNQEDMDRFEIPPIVELSECPLKTLQDMLVSTYADGTIQSANGVLCPTKGAGPGTVEESAFLSEKMIQYVLGEDKCFADRVDPVEAMTITKCGFANQNASISNYITDNGRLRQLTGRELLRLMGFPDSFKIVVSESAISQQAGNSMVVDVMMGILTSVINALGTA